MRYDLKLFRFILNLMEVMFLVQEAWEMPSWVIETNCKQLATTKKGIGTGSIMIVRHSGVGPLCDTGIQQCPFISMSML